MGPCFSAPAPKDFAPYAVAGAGAPDVLFFPDGKMPCRAVMRGGECRRGDACEYAHGRTSLTRLLDVIDAATKTLDVCVFTITCNEIADAVVAAHKRGVKVRVISDDDQANAKGSDVAAIRDAGMEVRTDAASTHMHHKFAVIDGKVLVNGSFNWTRQAVLGNQENVTVMRDARLAKIFAAEFERMWRRFGGGGGAAAGGKENSTDDVLFFPDGKMPCRAFASGKQCRRGDACEYAHEATSLTRLVAVIDAAAKTLDVCVFTITCNEIADAVVAAHKRGVKVRVISDDDQANAKGSDLASIGEAGVEVRTDAASTHMHHKFAVIDGETLLNGSFNWTRQAVLGNQENVMVLRDTQLASVFAAEFERMWGQFKANQYRG